MSAESRPIDPAAFAEALKDLPLSSVFAKIAELENSTAHLERSNVELRAFIQESDGGDKECEDAIAENEEVIERMCERVRLVKLELERRGERLTEPTNKDDDSLEEEKAATTEPASSEGQSLRPNGPSTSLQPGGESNGVPGSSDHVEDASEGVHL